MSRLIDAGALIAELHNVILEDGEDRRIIYEVIERQPTIDPRRWIPVDEGKPKDGTDCLVTYTIGCVEIATFVEDLYEFDEYNFRDKRGVAGWIYFDDEYGYQEYSGVMAWMPLPEPYQSET